MPVERSPAVLVLAHRGASRRERENTLAAFRAARDLGADGIELDVRRAADGAMVVHHDPLPRGELPGYVPTLAGSLDTAQGLLVNIEIKNDPTEADFDAERTLAGDVVGLLRARGGLDRVLISSFDLATIDAVRAIAPEIDTAWLVVGVDADTLDVLAAHGHHVLHPWHGSVDRALLEACHRRGVRVNVWTCDDPARMAELAAWGVDGVCTNVPDVAVTVRATGGAPA